MIFSGKILGLEAGVNIAAGFAGGNVVANVG